MGRRTTAKSKPTYNIRPMRDAEYHALGIEPPKETQAIKTRPPTRAECVKWGIEWLPQYEPA
jgi:hypothetical protein